MLFERTQDISFPMLDVTTLLCMVNCLISIVALLLIGRKKLHWFLHPTLVIYAFFVLRVQIPSIFYLNKAAKVLPIFWHYPFIIHGFALLFLLIVVLICIITNGQTEAIWGRMRRQIEEKRSLPGYFVILLLCCTGITMFAYFSTISLKDTGLYYLFKDPLGISTARELSLKLLPNIYVIYLYGWNSRIIVPLLVVASTIMILQRKRMEYILVAAAAIMSAAMSASRASFGVPVLVGAATYFFIRTKNIRYVRLVIFVSVTMFLAMLGPAIITMAREGRILSKELLVKSMGKGTFNRAVMAPAHSTLIYVYQTQVTETRGIAGIRPIAILLGKEYNEVTQEIGRLYVGHKTTIVNTNFLGVYYILFGLWTIPFCIVFVLLFDFFGLIFYLRDLVILPFFVLLVVKSMSVVESALTGALLTGGYLFIPILALISVWFESRDVITKPLHQNE